MPASSASSSTGRRYRGLTPEVRRAQRRQRLLDAGLEIFGTSGYPTSTIPALCSRAAVSNSHFYELFDSREALLVAVYDAIVGEVAAGAAAVLGADLRPPAAQIRAGLEAFVAPFVADERKARVNFIEVVGTSAAFERRRRAVLRGFAQIIATDVQRLVAAGLLEPRDRSVTAMALVGATNEPLVDWFATPRDERVDLETVLEELVRLFVAVLER